MSKGKARSKNMTLAPKGWDDPNLLVKFKKGDPAAFQTIFLRYHGGLAYVLTNVTKNRKLALEKLQDIFSALWETKQDLENLELVKRFLFEEVKRLCCEYLTSRDDGEGSPDEAGPVLSGRDLGSLIEKKFFEAELIRELSFLKLKGLKLGRDKLGGLPENE